MKHLYLLLLGLILSMSAWSACIIDEETTRNRLFNNTRSLFELDENTTITLVNRINAKDLEENANIAFLQLLSEDRFFDRTPGPDEENTCPDRINRVYRVYTQDPYRECNGVLKAEIMRGVHEVLYRNCGRN
jgi:hypothetical protein